MSKSITPNHREILAAQGLSGAPEYLTSTNGALNISGSFSVTGGATSINQTNGAQKTQIVDGSGNVVGSTTNALDVNIKSGSSAGTQYAELTTTAPATGTAALGRYVTSAPTLTNGQMNMPILDVNGNLKVNIAAGSSSGQQYADGTARGTATGTLMMVDDGTNIQSAIGTTAGVLKIDLSATTANATAVKVDGSAVTQPVSLTSTTITGTVTNNIAQINGVTPLMGNGTTGTGSLRVTIASDNTAFAVNSTLSAETTKVIGTVRTSDGAGNLYTTNSTTYTAKFAQDSNLLGTLGTAFSTAGKVDVKGADGDVFVRQTTGSNLHTVIDSGTLTAITNALPAGTNLLGKVGIDQTTLGTTNNVSLSVSSGAGASNLVKDITQFGDGVSSGVVDAGISLYNGTTYDRLRGDLTNGAFVNIKSMIALPAGSNVIGHVITDTGSTTVVTGTVTIAGAKTNNAAVPGATNIGTLPGVATASAPTYTEGNQVALSTDLTGALRISGGGGGTQYTELSTTSPSTATAVLGRYKVTPPVLTDGQMYMPQLDASGNLNVNVKAGSGSGLSVVDSALFTSASSSFVPTGGVYNDGAANLNPGQQGTVRLTADRKMKVDISGSNMLDNLDQVAGNNVATTSDGVQLVSVAGPTGDPINTTGDALNVSIAGVNPTTPLAVQTGVPTETVVTGAVGGNVGASVSIEAQGAGNVLASFSTSSSGTVQFEGLTDSGPLWTAMAYFLVDSTGSAGTTTSGTFTPTTNNIYAVPTMGYRRVRVRQVTVGATNTPTVATLRATSLPITQGIYISPASDAQLALSTGRNTPAISAIGWLFNGTNFDRARESVHAANTIGTGIQAIANLAEFDDVSPTTITENQFGNLRMSANRNLYGTIRDAAGNERGANVNLNNQLSVSVDNSVTQSVNNAQVAGSDIPTVADGVGLTALAGPTGDPLDTTGNALNVSVVTTAPVADQTNFMYSGNNQVQPQFTSISTAASGATTLVNAISGKTIRVVAYTLVANAAVNVKFQSVGTVTNDITGLLYLAANTGAAPGYVPIGHFQSRVGESLNINLSGAVAVGGHITYVVI